MNIRPLLYDEARCKPDNANDLCRNCKRWVDQTWQTMGPRTPVFVANEPDADNGSCGVILINGTFKSKQQGETK